ncbi:post-GPI attachment to proteins factor 6 [Aplysia californica]|uniref:Post-GPI attachment to proteins factor 6 n=1 Tax=Aplysia californica TaxID=6500 RepID=A0ABM0JZM3_APLCA|nr:post-GPI attachment to proteins factor 6 [Aplysia californica]XP_005105281.1 post-GPI attachment to proteins factor 6 [Aplysia californica]
MKLISYGALAFMAYLLAAGFHGSRSDSPLEELMEVKFHRTLFDYKMYAAITLERLDVPEHTVEANLTINVHSSSDSCPIKKVKIFANQFGLPVVSRRGESFPNHTFVPKDPVLNVTASSNNETVTWVLSNLKAGQLFLMAVMPRPDPRIKQQGLGQSCDYFLNIQAKLLHYPEENIPVLSQGLPGFVSLGGDVHTQTLLSFRVPRDAVSTTIEIQECDEPCPVKVSVWGALSPDMWDFGYAPCVWRQGSCTVEVMSPMVDKTYYLGLTTNASHPPFMVQVSLVSSYCKKGEESNGELTSWNSSVSPVSCQMLPRLGRKTPAAAEEGSNFYDHFLLWNKNQSSHSSVNLEVSDKISTVVGFDLRTTDTGSSLKVKLHTPRQKLPDLSEVILCLSSHKVPNASQCHEGHVMTSAVGSKAAEEHVSVPYPESGTWYVGLTSRCHHRNDSSNATVPCQELPKVNVSIQLSPCIDGNCGKQGTCKLYFGSDILYSACSCYDGWRGYGCNDGSGASSESSRNMAVYLLTLSNLGFLPGIVLALYRRHFLEGLVYTYNMFFSTFYHACDTDHVYSLCIMPYNALSFGDFFASLLSFWVTLLAMARIPTGVRSFFHMLGALFISVGEVYNRHGLLEQLLPILGGVVIVVVSWGVQSYRLKHLFPSRRRLMFFIAPGVLLASLGLIFNLALETTENYKYIHSVWHLLVSGSIVFLLPPRRGQKRDGSSEFLSVQSGDITRPSLIDDAAQPNIHSADDTGLLSDTPSPPATPNGAVGGGGNSRDRGFKLMSRPRGNRNLVL